MQSSGNVGFISVMNFRIPLERPVLRRNRVHLWRAVISPVSTGFAEACRLVLSADERRRADRFRAEEARESFEAGRGILRFLLGMYLGKDPAKIAFDYGEYGKPVLAGPFRQSGLHFSVSHADGVALYAFAKHVCPGVDIERVRPAFPVGAVSGRFLSPAELAGLQALPRTVRRRAFYACWTRKEAVLKAKGIGIMPGLREFDVTVKPGGRPRLLRCSWRGERPDAWFLRDIGAGRGFAAALAVKASSPGISCYRWTGILRQVRPRWGTAELPCTQVNQRLDVCSAVPHNTYLSGIPADRRIRGNPRG